MKSLIYKTMSYFNTTNESGTTLKNNVAKAKSQEIIVLWYFNKNKDNNSGYSASEIINNIFTLKQTPITSIRRALTNLTKQGKLIKTNEKRIGMYGRSEYVWKLNENTCISN